MRTKELKAHGGTWRWTDLSDYAFFADGEAPAEITCTGTALWPHGLARPLTHKTYPSDEPELVWVCEYCGSQYWVEDKELKCKNCGATRSIR
jgi:rubrerythrin